MIDKRLLEMMACPKCRGDVKEKGMFLLCRKCELAFPVLDNSIPNMIIEEAWPLKKAEKSEFKHN
ncbi:MAG: Trm112 family protein, partial [Candidatus Aenigmatarchaeota archaeon]